MTAANALTVVSGRTMGIPPLTLDRLTDLRNVRLELEGVAMAWAARAIDGETVALLEIDLARMDRSITAGDTREYLQANRSFHFAVYRASQSPALVGLIEILWLQISPYFNLLRGSGNYVAANANHRRMAEALKRGDAGTARAAIAADIERRLRGARRSARVARWPRQAGSRSQTIRSRCREAPGRATERRVLRLDGQPVLGLSQGRQRAYVFPLYTPQGFAVTSEAPADHPHHNSLWIAVRSRPLHDAGGQRSLRGIHLQFLRQRYLSGARARPDRDDRREGRGNRLRPLPAEPVAGMAGPGRVGGAGGPGRRRPNPAFSTSASSRALYVIDVASRLAAAEWDLHIGPTRHSYFNVRVAESMAVTSGGRVIDDRRREGGAAITGSEAKWIDYSGPVGGGHWAGVAVCPDPADHADITWFVTDWGVVTVGPFRQTHREIPRGEAMVLRYRVLVHDGDIEAAQVADRFAAYLG